jgi:hypothetical protein
MIDTVRYSQTHKLKRGYRRLEGRIRLRDEHDQPSCVRCFCHNGEITDVEFSLPKLLFGTNGRLISTQTEIDNALSKADLMIQRIATRIATEREFKRVDLVWNFREFPQDCFLAHLHCHYPKKRRSIEYVSSAGQITSLGWGLRKTREAIKMYDKTAKKIRNPLPIVRVEVQLRGDKLWQYLGNGKSPTCLDINTSYAAYRKIVVRLQPAAVPQIQSKDDALAYAESQGVKVLAYLAKILSKRQMTRLRAKVAGRLMMLKKINWQSRLPLRKLPPVYHQGPRPRVKLRLVSLKRAKSNPRAIASLSQNSP